MLPRLGTSKLVTRWLLVTIALSIACWIGGYGHWFSLAPAKIFAGQLWRLVTWPLVEPTPLVLLFTCIAIFRFGSELATSWSDRRLLRFVVHVALAGSIVTCAVAAVTGGIYMHRLAGWAIVCALAIGWARQFPERGVVLYGSFQLRGRQVTWFFTGLVIAFALYGSPVIVAPELVACGVAAAYPLGWLRT
jgi:membrane associated rhomboid family serine protease